jgi:transcription elongation factor Elf1
MPTKGMDCPICNKTHDVTTYTREVTLNGVKYWETAYQCGEWLFYDMNMLKRNIDNYKEAKGE